jgi:spore coat polysaccharide biosynthesis protein SpsF
VVIGPEGDSELGNYCSKEGIKYYLPHCAEDDVLTRYVKAAEHFDGSTIVRVTSDCWFSNAEMIAECASLCQQFDYASNTIHRSFFEGLDVQACSKKALYWFDKTQKEKREHPFIFFDENKVLRDEFEKQGFSYTTYINPRCEWTIKTSIDTAEDLERARHFVARRPTTDDLVLRNNRGH